MTYCTVEDLVSRLGGPNRVADDGRVLIETAIVEACGAIDLHCGQAFTKDVAATARMYAPADVCSAWVDPFWSTTDLVVKTDVDDDGVFETTVAAADYELDRFGGARAHLLGAPYDTVRSLAAAFPVYGRRRLTLQVTATWGWAAVPSNVSAAAKILAHDLWKRKDVAFGVATSGVAEFGGMRIGRDVLAQVAPLVSPFVRTDRSGMA